MDYSENAVMYIDDCASLCFKEAVSLINLEKMVSLSTEADHRQNKSRQKKGYKKGSSLISIATSDRIFIFDAYSLTSTNDPVF